MWMLIFRSPLVSPSVSIWCANTTRQRVQQGSARGEGEWSEYPIPISICPLGFKFNLLYRTSSFHIFFFEFHSGGPLVSLRCGTAVSNEFLFAFCRSARDSWKPFPPQQQLKQRAAAVATWMDAVRVVSKDNLLWKCNSEKAPVAGLFETNHPTTMEDMYKTLVPTGWTGEWGPELWWEIKAAGRHMFWYADLIILAGIERDLPLTPRVNSLRAAVFGEV